MDLDAMLDKIIDYDAVLAKYDYTLVGDGEQPWSHRYQHTGGTCVDIASSHWTMYPSKIQGETPDELELVLSKEPYARTN